jgi:uncharacterized membrane protein YgaE (UPF0421/DUF939 family)
VRVLAIVPTVGVAPLLVAVAPKVTVVRALWNAQNPVEAKLARFTQTVVNTMIAANRSKIMDASTPEHWLFVVGSSHIM